MTFSWLPAICNEIRANLIEIYWLLLIPFSMIIIILSFFKMPKENPDTATILRRVVISMLLLFSFDETINLLGMVGDGITHKIGGITKLMDVLNQASNIYSDFSGSWFKAREAIIFTLNLVCYMVAYIGVFTAQVLIQFVWSVLFIVSPLMILMYISEKTSHVTANLYKGLINVVVWKILWSILGILLLKLATAPQSGGWDNFLATAMINLCIGFSMLFIPFATKSLINDGLTGAASALAAIPAGATFKATQGVAKASSKRLKESVTGGYRQVHQRFASGIQKFEKNRTKRQVERLTNNKRSNPDETQKIRNRVPMGRNKQNN